MNAKIDLTVIILTFNEEKNIKYSITNVIDWAREVIVLDSYSNDSTVSMAESLGAKVFYRKFDNYAEQRNYAIKELPINHKWILFLDADEYLTEELKVEIDDTLKNETKYKGYYIKFKFIFLNKWMKYGGYYGTKIMRLFQKDYASVSRDINEHIVIDGNTSTLKNDFIHEDRKGLESWLYKHIKYANLESFELISNTSKDDHFAKLFGNQTQRKRWIRKYIWNMFLPPLIRPFIYFFYRYFIRLGFLDGKVGLIFHFLHGLWYIFLIDVFYLTGLFKTKYNSNKT